MEDSKLGNNIGTGYFMLTATIKSCGIMEPVYITPVNVDFLLNRNGKIEYTYVIQLPKNDTISLIKPYIVERINEQIHSHIDNFLKETKITSFKNQIRINYTSGCMFALRTETINDTTQMVLECKPIKNEMYNYVYNTYI